MEVGFALSCMRHMVLNFFYLWCGLVFSPLVLILLFSVVKLQSLEVVKSLSLKLMGSLNYLVRGLIHASVSNIIARKAIPNKIISFPFFIKYLGFWIFSFSFKVLRTLFSIYSLRKLLCTLAYKKALTMNNTNYLRTINLNL